MYKFQNNNKFCVLPGSNLKAVCFIIIKHYIILRNTGLLSKLSERLALFVFTCPILAASSKSFSFYGT